MFQQSSALVINKTDLLPYVPCDIKALKENAHKINPSLRVFDTSCTTGEGIDRWCEWLMQRRKALMNPTM
jgi:hydrogenase nickel incorporation protein HypB